MADGLFYRDSWNTTIRTLLKEVIKCVHWDNVLYARYHEFLPLWKHLFYLNVFEFYLLRNCNCIGIAIIDL